MKTQLADRLRESLLSAGLDAKSCDLLQVHWNKELQLKGQDFWIQEGQKEQYIYLMLEGTARIYILHDTNETCVGFLYPGNLFSAFDSLVSGRPTAYYIQTLRSARALAISRAVFYEIMEKEPAIERFWRRLLEQVLVNRMQREVELLTLSPVERLQRLQERSPQVFQWIPLKYIASYLHISAETLSRLRKK
jgi:CRP-like cAMP-binding protein